MYMGESILVCLEFLHYIMQAYQRHTFQWKITCFAIGKMLPVIRYRSLRNLSIKISNDYSNIDRRQSKECGLGSVFDGLLWCISDVISTVDVIDKSSRHALSCVCMVTCLVVICIIAIVAGDNAMTTLVCVGDSVAHLSCLQCQVVTPVKTSIADNLVQLASVSFMSPRIYHVALSHAPCFHVRGHSSFVQCSAVEGWGGGWGWGVPNFQKKALRGVRFINVISVTRGGGAGLRSNFQKKVLRRCTVQRC